jgi:hypothetical protein
LGCALLPFQPRRRRAGTGIVNTGGVQRESVRIGRRSAESTRSHREVMTRQ